jgi:hypothetical protein
MPTVHPRHQAFNVGRRVIGHAISGWLAGTSLDAAGVVSVLIACQQDVIRRKMGLPRVLTAIESDGLVAVLDTAREQAGLTDLELLAILAEEAEGSIWRMVRDERRPTDTNRAGTAG